MSNLAVVLFTRDLRVHDHPALAAAVERGDEVLPLFVLDPRVRTPPNRAAFLRDSLADLRASLEARGGGLALRSGDAVAETVRLALDHDAEVVHVAEDVSAFAQARERRLRSALRAARVELETFAGVTVAPPGQIAPAGATHYRVFSPYWRRWREEPVRDVLPAPQRVRAPAGVDWGVLPDRLADGRPAPQLPRGGETAGRERLEAWLAKGIHAYAELRNDLAADGTSRLSPYLHLGCVSPLELATGAWTAGAEEFVWQLCWRDFFAQLLAARPELSGEDMHARRGEWARDEEALSRWREGRTGVPLVDAAMRQLLREGWMHNRARLVVGSYLTKDLGVDWRAGAAHFDEHLVDGDLANNIGGWQWVAGTGTDPRPYRRLSPERQAERFDPDGAYRRRYLGGDEQLRL